jgi:hypothetical protein
MAVSLLSGSITLHDVADLEAHLRTDLDVQLKARGGFLAGYEYEDALTYFIGKGWELSLVYDSERGWSFSKLLRDRSRYWYVDYLRQRHGDSRYGQDVIAQELRDEDKPLLEIEWPEVLAMVNMALLSPLAQRTLERIVIPYVGGKTFPFKLVAEERGMTQKQVKECITALGNELEAKVGLKVAA